MSPTIVFSVDGTFGALFLGLTASAVFYGMTLIQLAVYHISFPKDPRVFKITTSLLWAMDTFHFLLSIHTVYHYLVDDRVVLPFEIVWSLRLQVLLNVLISLSVQSLYAWRVWIISGMLRFYFGYVAIGLILLGLASGLMLAVEVYRLDSLANVQSISWAIILCFASAGVIDLVISAAMLFCTRSAGYAFPHLNSRLVTVAVYTVFSGVLTTLCAFSALISYVVIPHSYTSFSLGLVLTRLYVNSFLALLNARPRTSPEQEKQNFQSGLTSASALA